MNRPCTILSIVLLAVLASPFPCQASEAVSEQIEWQAESDSDTRTIKFGELTVRLSRHPKPTDVEGAAYTQIEIWAAPGTRKAAFHAYNAFGPGATVQFAELDTKNRFPEVLFSTYGGGMHCCFTTMVLTFNGRKWIQVLGVVTDGVPSRAQDINKDGRAEFTLLDDAFLYAFASYAESNPPARIYHLSGTKWINVTRRLSFRGYHVTDPQLVKDNCNPEKSSNGFWAGYVASSILIGKGRAAWDRMLQCYDRSDSWESCKPHEWQECDFSFNSFPIALDEFLRSSDYGPAVSKREIARFAKLERAKWAVIDAERRKVEADRERLQAERTKRILANQKAGWARERAERERLPAARSEPLWQQIAKCWNPYDGGQRVLPRVQVRVFLSDKGTLIAPPQVIRPSSESLDQAQKLAVQAVLQAVNGCAPYEVEAAEVNLGHGVDLAF